MPSKGRDVIAIGTAAGGLEALDQLFGQLLRVLIAAFDEARLEAHVIQPTLS